MGQIGVNKLGRSREAGLTQRRSNSPYKEVLYNWRSEVSQAKLVRGVFEFDSARN